MYLFLQTKPRKNSSSQDCDDDGDDNLVNTCSDPAKRFLPKGIRRRCGIECRFIPYDPVFALMIAWPGANPSAELSIFLIQIRIFHELSVKRDTDCWICFFPILI